MESVTNINCHCSTRHERVLAKYPCFICVSEQWSINEHLIFYSHEFSPFSEPMFYVFVVKSQNIDNTFVLFASKIKNIFIELYWILLPCKRLRERVYRSPCCRFTLEECLEATAWKVVTVPTEYPFPSITQKAERQAVATLPDKNCFSAGCLKNLFGLQHITLAIKMFQNAE